MLNVLFAHAKKIIRLCPFIMALLFIVAFTQIAYADPNKKYTGSGFHYIAINQKAKPKYKKKFKHVDYVNPNAPIYGKVVLASLGSFDNLNPFIPKGDSATGLEVIYNTLLVTSDDEKNIAYAALAEKIYYDQDRDWVGFKLRREAKFSDGKPVTVEDVIWTFNTLIKKGNPIYRYYYAGVKKVERWGKKKDRKVRFVFKEKNNEMPYILGQIKVLPKHFWKGKDFKKTTLIPPVGSGPYKVKKLSAGKFIEFVRIKNYWGDNVPILKGTENFAIIRRDYYRSLDIVREALRSGKIDFFSENSAKNWVVGYDIPAVKNKRLIKKRAMNYNPQGMQGFFFNTRRKKFQDHRVREALDYAFDYEWLNKTSFYGTYLRATSYFNNSEFASDQSKDKLPSKAELTLLKPFKSNLPAKIFTQPLTPPSTDGSGNNRANLRTAKKLLEEAGWKVKNNLLRNSAGEIMTLEILISLGGFERLLQPFVKKLKQLGIKATIKLLNPAQFENRKRKFDFDMVSSAFGQSDSPGNEQLEYWGSKAAYTEGSRNLAGIKNPAVDGLIDKIIKAKTRKQLITATRALDRVLLANHYAITGWYYPYNRLLYWNIFSQPKINPKYSIGFNTWWVDKTKWNKLRK